MKSSGAGGGGNQILRTPVLVKPQRERQGNLPKMTVGTTLTRYSRRKFSAGTGVCRNREYSTAKPGGPGFRSSPRRPTQRRTSPLLRHLMRQLRRTRCLSPGGAAPPLIPASARATSSHTCLAYTQPRGRACGFSSFRFFTSGYVCLLLSHRVCKRKSD